MLKSKLRHEISQVVIIKTKQTLVSYYRGLPTKATRNPYSNYTGTVTQFTVAQN